MPDWAAQIAGYVRFAATLENGSVEQGQRILKGWHGRTEGDSDAPTPVTATRKENAMSTDDRNDFNGEQPRDTALGFHNVDESLEAVRESTEAIRQSSMSASSATEETIAETQAEADTMGVEAEVVLADARTEADRLIADSKDETEARLKEAEEQAARHLAQAADQAEELLRDARAEHDTLTEAIPQLRAAEAEVYAFIDAFRDAVRRFEEATGDMTVLGETEARQRRDRREGQDRRDRRGRDRRDRRGR
jgi:hypothetical protein